ncbi:hypothetical protein [Pedobacter metabolipauper]|uniref:Uncharacterized protein n=1 Tax=Pedobacter metabolipauper TaxID=425513 RepID=A0A4R6SUY4_9SPHI|nr:hypothetical protein [Pedobacter metabolipauper]TDQ08888.1 hypothetical protein ATK78_3409 [Pedobacter metabolipauper]
MGLKMRITYNDKDYVYEIIDGASINKETTDLKIILNGHQLSLHKDASKKWVVTDSEITIDPDFAQAIGRSVSLRYRM